MPLNNVGDGKFETYWDRIVRDEHDEDGYPSTSNARASDSYYGVFFDAMDFSYNVKLFPRVGVGSTYFYKPRVDILKPTEYWNSRLSPYVGEHIVRDVDQVDRRVLHLEKRIWKYLPEELFPMIQERLPLAHRFRVRLVCKKWNLALSQCSASLEKHDRRPSFTVKWNPGEDQIRAYCHTERSWYNFPSSVVKLLVSPPDQHVVGLGEADSEASDWSFYWQLEDVDAEFFCYGCPSHKNNCVWVAVCNPLIPGAAILLPPCHHLSRSSSLACTIKLVVDRQAKTFKVVVIWLSSGVTNIFDSVSARWTTSHGEPYHKSMFPLQSFVWKNSLYICGRNHALYHLDMESGAWSDVRAEFPSQKKKFSIISSEDQVLLIQVNLRVDDFIRVWKLRNSVSDHVKPFSAASWEKQMIVLPPAIKYIAADFYRCTSHGNEYICFTDGYASQWIKYTFAIRTWHLMPRCTLIPPPGCIGIKLHDWEPGMEMRPQSGEATGSA